MTAKYRGYTFEIRNSEIVVKLNGRYIDTVGTISAARRVVRYARREQRMRG